MIYMLVKELDEFEKPYYFVSTIFKGAKLRHKKVHMLMLIKGHDSEKPEDVFPRQSCSRINKLQNPSYPKEAQSRMVNDVFVSRNIQLRHQLCPMWEH